MTVCHIVPDRAHTAAQLGNRYKTGRVDALRQCSYAADRVLGAIVAGCCGMRSGGIWYTLKGSESCLVIVGQRA